MKDLPETLRVRKSLAFTAGSIDSFERDPRNLDKIEADLHMLIDASIKLLVRLARHDQDV